MPRAPRLVALVGFATSALLAHPVAAQTEFAVPLGRGQLRIDFTPLWSSWDHRFDPNTPGPVPITADYTTDSLGVATLPFLTGLEDTLRAATGLGTFSLNLGHPLIALTSSVRTMPIGIELGLTRRLAIGVMVPIVRSRVDVSFQLDSAPGRQSNVGWNPGYLDPTKVATFRAQMTAALAALQAQADSGPAALRAQAQAAIVALQPFLAVSGSPFLPRGNTPGAKSFLANLGYADSLYAALAAQYQALGDSVPTISATLVMPDSTPLGRDDLERLFSDPALPVAADTFGTVVRTGLGDVAAHLTYQFADGARYRGQLVVTTRFPTGTPPSASNFLDLGTGTHQLGFEVALANDLLLGDNFLLHVLGRAGGARPDQLPMRVTPPELPIAPLSQLADIKRTPPTYVALDLAPTWRMDDAFSVQVAYGFFSEGATRHSYVNPSDSARVGWSASVLDEGTAMRWMRIGGGVTFSTVSRYAKGRATLPYSLSVGFDNTIWGGAGRVPQAGVFHINLRAYIRLFGH